MLSRKKLSVALRLLSFGVVMVTSNAALGQATQRAAFVANNGNLEGSVTAFRIEDNGTATFVNRIVTGTRTSTSQPCSGCNAYTISITPNGKYLATGHAAGNDPLPDGLTIFHVNADGFIAQVLHMPLPLTNSSPLGVRWITDQYLAVTRTSTTSANNGVAMYAFNPNGPSLTQIDSESISGFTSAVEVHPNKEFLYAQSTGPSAVHVFRIHANGTLTFLNSFGTSIYYPLGPGLSPDGTKLYYGGGISGPTGQTSRWIGGFNVDPATGSLTQMPNSPYLSPPSDGTSGPSPKQVAVASDNQYAFVNHGGTAHLKGFQINQKTGELTPIQNSYFDVGGQGDSGNIVIVGNSLFVTRRYNGSGGNPPAGLISLTIHPDGTLTQNGANFPTGGITPNDVAAWGGIPTPCPPDINGDNQVNVSDLLAVINGWGACPAPCPPNCPADVNDDCAVNVSDLLAVINAWGACP